MSNIVVVNYDYGYYKVDIEFKIFGCEQVVVQ